MTRRWKTVAVAFLLALAPTVAPAQYGTPEWFKAGSNPEHYETGADRAEPREGAPILTIRSLPSATEKLAKCIPCFGTYMRAQSAEPHRGHKVRFSARVRTRRVERWAGLWLRVDGPDGRMLAFDNMQGRPVRGDTDWTSYEVVLPVDEDAVHLAYGLLLNGPGQAWMDDVGLEEVGDDVATTGRNDGLCQAPKGWVCAGSRPADYEMGADHEVKRGGEASAFVRSKRDIPSGFGTLMQSTSATAFRGRRVRLSGWVKSEGVEPGWAGLWLRVDGPEDDEGVPQVLAFDNMGDRPVRGTSDWTRHQIVLDVPEEAQELFFGILLERNGTVWMEDLQFEVVTSDVPVTGSAQAARVPGPRNLDFEED